MVQQELPERERINSNTSSRARADSSGSTVSKVDANSKPLPV